MKIIRKIKNKQFILLGLFFVLFFLSYTKNVFLISDSDLFHGFERQPEGLVVGRLVRSAQDGLFSYGGLNGVNSADSVALSVEAHASDLARQHDLYINHADVPPYFRAYKSQSAGQALIMGALQNVLPFDNVHKLAFFRGINALLVALIFVLFGAWVYRNHGFLASLITLLLTFLSPWLNVFAHNLWWVLWNFYLPFLTMLFLLEYRNKSPEKVSKGKIIIAIFLAVFLKCFFSGFEFITTTLISAFVPVVYYGVKEKQSLRMFITDGVKYSLAMLAGVLAQMLILITQIRFLEGQFSDGVNHILTSFVRRSEVAPTDSQMSLFELIKAYLANDAFALGFLPNNIPAYFGVLIIIAILALILIYKKKKDLMKPLIITTAFSILAPLSWLVIFKQHSIEHMHMDYIIWYIPFLLYVFCTVGVAVSLLISKKRKTELE